jgi:hypothetical protein
MQATRTGARPVVLGAAVVAGITFLAGCGDSAENGIEAAIERQSGGDVDVDLDSDGGFSIQTEDGSMTIDEDGNFVITDDNGETITGQAGADDGEFNVESDDGSFSAGATTELPDDWPAAIPEPDGLAVSGASVIGSDTERVITVSGSVDGDGFVDSYGTALESAGFTQDSTFESGDTVNRVYSNGDWNVGIVFFGDASEDQVTVTIYSEN